MAGVYCVTMYITLYNGFRDSVFVIQAGLEQIRFRV